jgi:hypothetical protein
MVGADVVVGYVFAWLVGKARRVGARADGQVDEALDAGVDRVGERLHELVSGRLHDDPAWERLTGEAREGLEVLSARTGARVALALEDAVEHDPAFGGAVDELVARLSAGGTVAGPGGVAVAGSLDIRAGGGSIAAGVIHGGARVGNPLVPGPRQG